jgi:hypothetical protein
MTTATAPETTETAPASDTSDVSADKGTAPETEKSEAGKTLLTTPTEEPKAFALALPDGSPLDPAVLTRITDLAQKAGVTDEKAAQEIVDLLHGEASATIDSIKTAFAKDGSEWTKIVKAHEAAALADPALGANDPAKLSVAVTEAKAVIGKFAPEGFTDYLDESGLGSDPRFLKFARAVYAGMKEDTLVKGNPMPPKPKTAAQRMFPNLPSEEG